MRALLLALAVTVGCHPGPEALDSADDTGGPLIARHALGGERPGFVATADDPLSTFPLDGSQPYEGEVPTPPAERFAVQTRLRPLGDHDLTLDIGLAAGPLAPRARDIGVRLAFNPLAVERYRLVGAKGTGTGTELQRIPSLAPGATAGAHYELLTRPAQGPQARFLGTLTLTWTEEGTPQQRVVVLDRPLDR